MELLTSGEAGYRAFTWAERRGLIRLITQKVRRKNEVLVLGISGSGKTNFLKSLETPAIRPIDRFERSQFTQRHNKVFANSSRAFRFHDTPGQAMHISRRMEALRTVAAKKRFGIINVVSYGYVESGSIPAQNAVKNGTAVPSYLQQQRDLEIDAIKEWLPAVAHEAEFIITLVSKADLWFSSRHDVRTHYETGFYGEAISRAGVKRHSVIEYSSVIHNFFDEAAPSSKFDQSNLMDLHEQFSRQIVEAVTE